MYRTDLALEAREMNAGLSGVTEEQATSGGVAISRITVQTEEAAKKLEKPCGRYITLNAPDIAERSAEVIEEAAHVMAVELMALLSFLNETDEVLVVGLGNRQVTPDSLGPRVIEKLYVTRHIRTHAAELAPEGLRSVAAVAPGVLGVTGIETLEIVRGIAERTAPKAILCVDALASRRAQRIHTVIQMNDSGILPGAGVGNRQAGLNQKTLGIPVIAVGVPTVLYASTIVAETLHAMGAGNAEGMDEEQIHAALCKQMESTYEDMIVTPKDVDQMIRDSAGILAEGINRALHHACYTEIAALLS